MSTSPMRSRRSLAACEGALLVVDAAQGVEAQTLANVYQSIEHDHEIVPVINKIDLPAAEPEKVRAEIEDIIGLDAIRTPCSPAPSPASASTTCSKPSSPASRPPKGDRDAPLKAMLVDSWYDPYLGVVILVRVIDGVDQQGPQRQVHARRHRAPDRPRRLLHPQAHRAARRARPGRDRLHHRADQGSRAGPRRRHHHHGEERRHRGAARLQGSPAGGVLRPVPGRRRRFREAARKHLPACASTTPASASRWKAAPRSASASAAASSACCTWRSSRNG